MDSLLRGKRGGGRLSKKVDVKCGEPAMKSECSLHE